MRALCVFVLCWPALAVAVERTALKIESIEGEGWALERLSLEADLPPEGAGRAQLTIAEIRLPAPIGTLKAVTVDCGRFELRSAAVSCADGHLRASTPHLADHAAALTFTYRPDAGSIEWTVLKFPLWGGQLKLDGKLKAEGWEVQGSGVLDAQRVLPLLAASGAPKLSGGGKLDMRLSVRGGPGIAGKVTLTSTALNLNDAAGRYAAEQLNTKLELEFQPKGNAWKFAAEVKVSAGQAYIEPLFLDAAKTGLTIQTAGLYAKPALKLEQIVIRQTGALQASGTAELTLGDKLQVNRAQAELHSVTFPSAYQTWLQPFLSGGSFANLETAGTLSGRLHIRDSALDQAQLKLKQLFVHDPQERYSMDALNGELHWARTGDVPATTLRWQGGNAHRLPFGGSELRVALGGMDARLLAPLRLPLLDGALVIGTFSGTAMGTPEMKLDFDGSLEPIDLAALSTALGWPVFGGKLAGELPRLTYKKEVLTLGGTLHAEVFGGRVELEKFYLKDPFSRVPRLGANLRARNLDLEPFTQAFSFGKIEGRLNADVDKLRLQNWKPLSFSARLYTPEDDKSRHRISQRAVDHLASIGSGGATNVLSGTMLRFFKEFRYDRLGLGCEMTGGVCRMTGIEDHPKGGYYIVKGSGVPRIDVVGFVNQVAWETLVEQLYSVTQGGSPVIQ